MADLFQDVSAGGGRCVAVLVPYPVDKAYDYLVPNDMEVEPGDYVLVPLGNRQVTGVVWGEAHDDVPAKKLKTIIHKYILPPMEKHMCDFIDWVARYTLNPVGSVLKMALNVPAALEPPLTTTLYYLKTEGDKLTPTQDKVIKALGSQKMMQADLARSAGVSAGVIKTLADKGVLSTIEAASPPPCCNPKTDFSNISLSPEQQKAANSLTGAVSAQKADILMLDGVTGSGKTEVYFEAVAKTLAMGKQVLILMPEIALSNAFIDRFEKRFGCKPALWHSSLTPANRRITWRGIAESQCRVVVGARSALFLPFSDLGLIIVDESHDGSYKQEEGVIYHARDMAVVRGHLSNAPVVLASATPALETMHNVWEGRYQHIRLPERHGGASMPDIHIIDLREDKPARQSFLSPTLLEAIKETTEQGAQSLLFLNRRGYAPLTLCRTCGYRFECPRCTAWLVEHRHPNGLNCHHCGYGIPIPEKCPECGEEDSLAPCGPGIERIEEEAKSHFPDARIAVLSSDISEDQSELRKMLDQIRRHKYDIVIGTQIIAKGHHFPKLATVGIVDADIGLHGGDLRAAERSFQLLHQVAGRAGRELGVQGRVFLQSFNPSSRVIEALASGDRDQFLDVEAEERKAANMPPYARLGAIIIFCVDEDVTIATARNLAKCAPNGPGLVTYGPAQAPLYRIRGRYRYRFLVHAEKHLNIQKAISDWRALVKIPSTVKVQIDIDPQSFL
ncbi:MAG: primosomal protein N' [Micavibrio sp.]|nr:primosomal protein N' [Micavibrio sp.]